MAMTFDELEKLSQPQPQGQPGQPGDFSSPGAVKPPPTPTGAPTTGGADYAALGAPQQPIGTPQPAKNTGVAGGAPLGAPTATPGPMDPNAVWGTLQNQFQTKFNRAMTGDEAKALQQYAGYTGGDINQAMIDKATQGISAYSGNLANPFGAAPSSTPTVTPEQQTGTLAQQELQRLLTTGSTDAMNRLDMDNPAIRAQRANFERMNDRAVGRQRLAAAERAAASNGLGSGGFNADLAAAEQAGGDRAVQFESQLMTQELQGQRDRVQKALEMAVATGDQQQARALQERLGVMDMNLRERLGKGQLGLGLLESMLRDKQAGNQLGLGYAQLGQRSNESLLNAILGGL